MEIKHGLAGDSTVILHNMAKVNWENLFPRGSLCAAAHDSTKTGGGHHHGGRLYGG